MDLFPMTVQEANFSTFLREWANKHLQLTIKVEKAEFFSFSFFTRTLYWSWYGNIYAKKFYLDFLREKFPQIDLNQYHFFTISFLHELGHIISERDLGSDFLVTQFKVELKELPDNSKQAHYTYFNQPGEVLATSWLISFCYNHSDIVKQLDQDIGKYLKDFYDNSSDML